VIISGVWAGDGVAVTVARFAGVAGFRLRGGGQGPGSAALRVVRAGPGAGGGERRRLLAAFNGGFLLSAGAGGFDPEGHVISRLRRGLAGLVIDRPGIAHIGVWGSGRPRPRSGVQRSAEPATAGRSRPRHPGRRVLGCLGNHSRRWRIRGA
jgi:hypothetical protein